MKKYEEFEKKRLERIMLYNYKYGRRTELKDGFYYVYDGHVLLARIKQEIVNPDLIAN